MVKSRCILMRNQSSQGLDDRGTGWVGTRPCMPISTQIINPSATRSAASVLVEAMITATGDYRLILTQQHSTAEVELGGLVEDYGPLLFRVAYAILRSRSDAEDVVQDTLVRVLEHRKSLPQVRDLRVWLVRICWNLALDRRRRIKPQQIDDALAGTLTGSSVPADQALDRSRQMTLLLQAIERLPKLEKQALLLSAVEELSTSETALVMNKSESAVRALVFRARTRLKERMKGGRR
jgi:RNA polymerase sigma-70 factor (ECF subfamily)